MAKGKYVVVTGGSGFLGSGVIWGLNKLSADRILVVDRLSNSIKWKNLTNLKFCDYIEKDEFLQLIEDEKIKDIDTIFHLGAITDTCYKDASTLIKNNYQYSKTLLKFAIKNQVRFIYASSGATYGNGSFGFDDDENKLENLKPLNLYGYIKHLFDLWVKRMGFLDKVVCLKYFNVFGPNEYHKGDMRSVVCKGYYQILKEGKIKLFKSYRPDFKDGLQKRDFLYVKDAVWMTLFFYQKKDLYGIFNIASGEANSWLDVALSIFEALNKEPNIEFIDMPEDLKKQYQYYTCANIQKIKNAGYDKKITPLKEAIYEYVNSYLKGNKYLGDVTD